MANKRYIEATTSFSGADLVVTFGSRVIGELQQITWGIQREKAPVYTLGSADMRSVSRGKRGIGGSLIFAQFNRDAVLEEMRYIWQEIALPAMFTASGNLVNLHSEDFSNAISLAQWDTVSSNNSNIVQVGDGSFDTNGTTIGANTDIRTDYKGMDGESVDASGNPYSAPSNIPQVNAPHGFSTLGRDNIVYVDMLPPFDITLTFANEYGNAAFQRIYDVDIMNDASGLSVDSMVMERQMSYIARRMSPLLEGVFSRDSDKNINAQSVFLSQSGNPVNMPKVNSAPNRTKFYRDNVKI